MANNKKKGSIKVKNPNALNWFKNVGKSLGYSSTDLINEMMPATIDFTTSNIETVKELYQDLKQLRSRGGRISDSLLKNNNYNIASSAIKNAISDIKSGKIYNKERQDSMFSDDEFALSDEFNFDDGFDMDSESKESNINIVKVEGNINRNNPMVKAVEKQTYTMVASNQASDELNVSLASNALIANKRIGTGIMQGLDAINSNLSLLVNFQSESMTKYISASLKYYEENIRVLNDTLTEIKKSSPLELSPAKMKEDPLDSLFSAKGGLNIKGYANLIKKQLGNAIDSNMFLAPIKSMLEDDDTLKFLAASPLSFVSTKIITSLVPGLLKAAMTDMDKTFQGFFPAMLMKINRLAFKSDNPILQLVGQIFGVNVKSKSSVDMSQFNKGPVPFDGYTKKAITDVIPSYLRKILATLSGKEEMGFDYETGTFKSVHQIQEDFKGQRDRLMLNQFSDVLDELKDRANAFYIENAEERTNFQKDIDKFFLNLAKSNHLVNPTLTKDKDGNLVDELSEVYDFSNNKNYQKFFRQMVLSLPKNMQMQMFGSNVINARREKDRFMTDIEQNHMKNNANILFSGLGFDEHITRDRKLPSSYTLKKGSGGLIGVDKYNFNSLDYLRQIKKLLLQGIIVYPQNQISGKRFGGNIPEHIQTQLAKMDREDSRLIRPQHRYTPSSQSQIKSRLLHGRRTVDSLEFADLNEGDFRAQIETYVSERDKQSRENQNDSIFKWFGSFLKGDTQEKYNLIREKVNDIFSTPAKLLTNVFRKIDNTMYEMVFGKQDENGNASFFSKTLAIIRTKFDTFTNWMKNDIFLPVKEALFGKDGLITKLKNSQLFQSTKGHLSKMADYLFGKPTGENNAREGGLFSETANSMLDIWDSGKYYFTGKAYTNRAGVHFAKNNESVFGEMKNMFTSFKDNLKEYIFGNKDTLSDDNKGVLTGIVSGISQGFQNFSDAMFGPKIIGGQLNKNYIAIDEMTKKIKERAPKALATGIIGGGAGLLLGGKLGLLGSLLLPGGPIGGAVVGTTLGFLSQSDKFKNWLFGQKDDTGQRVGGFVSKQTQDFLKKNKAGIIGGATLGVTKSILGFGLLPSFFLPGGPIGGAVMGMGVSLLARSEKFKKVMFGEEIDGERQGGVLDKLFGQFRKGKNKNLFGNIAAGAIGGAGLGLITNKFGLMGAMLLPGGPLGGAFLGAAAGIALSSDKWRKVLFGEFDEDTQLRKGGLFGKFVNWTKLEILAPLKMQFKEISINMQEWFTKGIANPFLNAIDPIKQEIKYMVRGLKDSFVEGWKNFQGFLGGVFEKHVGMPFGRFMNDHVMKPLKGFFSRILGGLGRIVGSVVSAPFKGLEGISRGLTKKHMQRGLDEHIRSGWDELMDFRGRRERGEKLGFIGGIKKLWGMYGDREARDAARYGSEGAPYARDLELNRAKRESEANEKFARKRAAYNLERDTLNKRRRIGLANDYDNFDANGNPISTNYRTHDEGKSSYNRVNKSNIGISQQSVDGGGMFSSPVQDATERIATKNNIPISSGGTPIGDTSSTGRSSSENVSGSSVSTSKSRQLDQKVALEVKPQVMNQMASDIRVIAKEVNGQLDGVGSNVFKIRKMMQSQQGIGDEDLTGSSNRDRVGILGKMRRALYRPIDTIKETLMKPVRWVSEKITSFGEGIKKVTVAIIKVPITIGKAIGNFGKELLSIGKETFLSLIKIPGALIKTVSFAFESFAQTLKILGPAIGESLKGVAKIFSGAMGLVAHSLIGFGKGVGEILYGFGQGIGEITIGIGKGIGNAISGMSKALFKAVPMVTDFLFSSAKTITDFTFSVVKNVGEKLIDIGDSLFRLVTSPIKFMAGTVSKLTGGKSEVFIAGGTLDKVKEIGFVSNKRGSIGADKSKIGNLMEPMPVKIVTSSVIPVKFVTTSQGSSGSNTSGKGSISKGFDQVTKSLYGALNIFDEENDIEEDNKEKSESQKAKLIEQQKYVSRKTGSYMLSRLQVAEEKKFTRDNELQQTSLLSTIATSIKEHNTDWSGIFGKKGVLTVLALLALPYIKKLFEWFLGKGNDDRIDNSGATIINQDLVEDTTRGVAYGLKQASKKVVKPVAQAGNIVAKNAKKLYGKLTGQVDETVKKGTVKVAIEDSSKIVDDVKKGQVVKVKELIKQMMEKIFTLFEQKCGPGVKNAFGKINAIVGKVFTNDVIRKTLPKWRNGLVKIAGAASTLFLSDVAWATYGTITGGFEAARLFKVDADQVDWKMRVISSVMKGLLSVSWFFLIEIANDVFVEITNMDFLQMIATNIYKNWVDDKKGTKLEAAQAKFKADAEADGLSTDAWNDKQNKSVAAKVGGSVKSAGKNVLNFIGERSIIGGQIKGAFNDTTVRKNLGLNKDAKISLWDRIKSSGAQSIQGATFGLVKAPTVAKGAKFVKDKALEDVENAWNYISHIGGEVAKGAEQTLDGTKKSVKELFSPKLWSTLTGDIKKSWEDTKKIFKDSFTSLKKNTKDIFGTIGKNLKEDLTGIKKIFTGVIDSVKTFFKNIGSFITDSDIFKGVEKGWDSFKSLFGNGDLRVNREKDEEDKDKDGGGFGIEPSTVNNFAYFSQADDRWDQFPYDLSPGQGKSANPTIKARGCGPTSAAMVVSQLTGKRYTPPQMAQIAQQGGYSTKQGTAWSFFDTIAKRFSMKTSRVDPRVNKGTIKTWLNSGLPVVMSGTRKGSSPEASPFTSAGHFVVAVGTDGANRIKINDPRGAKFSKSYDFNTVLNESKQAWAFKYDGGPIPPPISENQFSDVSVQSAPEKLSTLDLFGKLGELFNLYSDNIFKGTSNQLSWGLDSTGYPLSAPSGNTSIDFIPKTLQDAILKKAVEETLEHESGGRYTFARNDINASTGKSISPSIGALQWRGGNARVLMQRMAARLPNDSEAKYFASKDWANNAPWSESEQSRLRKFLTKNQAIAKQVQDEFAISTVGNNNLSQVYKYGVIPKKISDPRSIVFLADMANTGPAHIKSFMSAYKPTSSTGKSEFNHLYNEFLTKSYWGKRSNIYSGRMKDLYSDLVGWDPEQGGYGGGFGDLSETVADKLSMGNSNANRSIITRQLPSFRTDRNSIVTNYMNSGDNSSLLNADLLTKAIYVLQQIATNTNLTTEGIENLSKMKIEVQTGQDQKSNETQNNVIITSPDNNNVNINPFLSMMDNQKNFKESSGYNNAKAIAKGRVS